MMLLNAVRRLAKLAFAILFCLILSVVASAAEPKRVLLINSYGSDFEPFRFFVARFRAELAQQSSQPLDYYDVPLFSARFTEGARANPFLPYLDSLFSDRHIDLVVAVGAPAGRFVQKHRGELFSSTPLLLTAMEERRLGDVPLGDRDAAVVFQVDRFTMFQNIINLLPETNEVAVVIGNSPNSLAWRDTMVKQLEPLRDKVAITWLNDLSFSQVLRYVAFMPSRSAIYFGPIAADSTNVPPEAGSALSAIHGVANAPLFGTFDAYLGQGIVGGPLVSLSDLAREAAKVSVQLLRSGQPEIAKTSLTDSKLIFDGRELQRWNISEARLPAGSTVLFREPSAWERYRWYIASVSGFSVLAVLVVIILLINRNRLRRAHEEAYDLSEQLLKAQDSERARIARELHDDLSQRLAGLAIHAGAGTKGLKSLGGLSGLYQRLVRLSEDVHALSYRLHPSALVDFGLQAAIESECTHITNTTSIVINVHLTEPKKPSARHFTSPVPNSAGSPPECHTACRCDAGRCLARTC